MYLTRFKYPDQRRKCWRRKCWREDLLETANQTVAQICPNWGSNSQDRAIYDLIQNEAQRSTNPRRDWLFERAYMWLKLLALQPPQNAPCPPVLAVQVAYQLFLSGPTGKIESFVKFLKKKKQPQIDQFVTAYEEVIAGTMGLCLLIILYSMRTQTQNRAS